MSYVEELQNEIDETLTKLVRVLFKKGDIINTTRIQFLCKCGYYSASRVLLAMVESNEVSQRLDSIVEEYRYQEQPEAPKKQYVCVDENDCRCERIGGFIDSDCIQAEELIKLTNTN